MASQHVQIRFSGQQLIDAVKAVAGNPVVRELSVDDQIVYNVGQQSGYPYRNLIVHTDAGDNIDPEENYESFVVTLADWGRETFHLEYGEEVIKKAVASFTINLYGKLQEIKIIQGK